MRATIQIRAVTKGRPRLGRRRKAYTPDKTVQFEKAIAAAWAEQNPDMEPLTGPLYMRVIIGSEYVEIDLEELETPARPKYITGDVDNYVKSISDGLNTVAYLDDKQIHHMEVYLTKESLDND